MYGFAGTPRFSGMWPGRRSKQDAGFAAALLIQGWVVMHYGRITHPAKHEPVSVEAVSWHRLGRQGFAANVRRHIRRAAELGPPSVAELAPHLCKWATDARMLRTVWDHLRNRAAKLQALTDGDIPTSTMTRFGACSRSLAKRCATGRTNRKRPAAFGFAKTHSDRREATARSR